MTQAQEKNIGSKQSISEAIDYDRIREAYMKNPSQMTSQLARTLGVGEAHVIRALPSDRVTELDGSRWEEIIRSFEQLGKTHVLATNQSVTLECFGEFGNFSTTGTYFNVQTKSIDMHIRHETLDSIFAVQKPGHMDGVMTLSFQFFNREGVSAFKVFLTFGNQAPSAERRAAFDKIVEQFKLV